MSSTTPTKEGRDDEGRKDNGKLYSRVGDRGFKEGCDETRTLTTSTTTTKEGGTDYGRKDDGE